MLHRLVDRILGLAPSEGPKPVVTRDIAVPMPDGARLYADRYRPPGDEPMPVVLIRSIYGRKGLFPDLVASVFARRGLQVVTQSVRGTFGSEGTLSAFHQEREDGLATVAWLRDQRWCDGRVAMAGASYLGHTAWAVAPYLDEPLEALCAAIVSSDVTDAFYPGGAFALGTWGPWGVLVAQQEKRTSPLQGKKTARAIRSSPVSELDIAATGERIPFLREVTARDVWSGINHREAIPDLKTPASLFTGWYDIFLQGQLDDFKALQAAGTQARITIGPWSHAEPSSIGPQLADQASWLRAHFGLESLADRQPVRLFLQNADRWLDFDQWPPAESVPTTLHLAPGGELSPEPGSTSDSFTYDPADPTPSIGGAVLSGKTKQQDNNALEARPDVLVYTGEPLEANLDVIGEITAVIHVDAEQADIFVRLCDVSPQGVSRNVTDGIVRLRPGQATAEVTLDPTAYRFGRGHRLRMQISGGAFPRFDRPTENPCPIEISHTSRIILPVFGS
ncbi:CocE/NonD family hydrolase [Amycolatopsis sp. NPDC059657]|uniref:CocE/NonD family hydrolase n=1 Tax=Amycolatopsis sp. NPDC059657 TaxID=3346899 RepID=UPI00366CC6BA